MVPPPPRRCPVIMQVRVEFERKSFGSSRSGSSWRQEQGRNSGVAHAASVLIQRKNHIFTFQLQHNHLRRSKFCSMAVKKGPLRVRRSPSFDIFASLLRVGSEFEFPPCSAAQFGSAICAITIVLMIKSS